MLLLSVLLVLGSAARFSLGADLADSDVQDRVREYEPSHIDMLSVSCGMHLHGDLPYSPYCLLTYKCLSIGEGLVCG